MDFDRRIVASGPDSGFDDIRRSPFSDRVCGYRVRLYDGGFAVLAGTGLTVSLFTGILSPENCSEQAHCHVQGRIRLSEHRRANVFRKDRGLLGLCNTHFDLTLG